MDQSEKIKLLEAQIKNLEKIIELQDKLIAQNAGIVHVPFFQDKHYVNPNEIWCGDITTAGEGAVITNIGKD